MASVHDIVRREHRQLSEESGAKSVVDHFGTNDIDEASATLTYIGKEDADGVWVIQKIDESSGLAIGYATQSNNPSVTSYAEAWANRDSLTYGSYSEAF